MPDAVRIHICTKLTSSVIIIVTKELKQVLTQHFIHALHNQVSDVFSPGVRNTSESKFQAVVLEEMNQLKAKIQAETEARVAEDEEIVNAVNDYTRALQDGLRIVSQT